MTKFKLEPWMIAGLIILGVILIGQSALFSTINIEIGVTDTGDGNGDGDTGNGDTDTDGTDTNGETFDIFEWINKTLPLGGYDVPYWMLILGGLVLIILLKS